MIGSGPIIAKIRNELIIRKDPIEATRARVHLILSQGSHHRQDL
jgi:hypothetical protein